MILELGGKEWTRDVNLGVISIYMVLKALCKLSWYLTHRA